MILFTGTLREGRKDYTLWLSEIQIIISFATCIQCLLHKYFLIWYDLLHLLSVGHPSVCRVSKGESLCLPVLYYYPALLSKESHACLRYRPCFVLLCFFLYVYGGQVCVVNRQRMSPFVIWQILRTALCFIYSVTLCPCTSVRLVEPDRLTSPWQ